MKEQLIQLRDHFLARPAEDWCINNVFDEKTNACCAVGHTFYEKDGNGKYQTSVNAIYTNSIFNQVSNYLQKVIPVTLHNGYGTYYGDSNPAFLIHVNNGCYNEYQQFYVRDRVIAAIEDGIKAWDAEHPEYKDITKELAILPVNEVPDKVLEVSHA